MREKGSILIFALWVLVILTIFSIVLSRRASSDIKLAKYESGNIKATYLVRAGVMKMLTGLTRDTNSYDSLNEDWNRDNENPKELTFGSDAVFYGASDESSRLNLNSAILTRQHLLRLGIDDSIAGRILEYRNEKGAKGFEFMEELFLVEDMTHELFSTIKDSITIYRGTDSKVNINTASEEALDAILGDQALVYQILEYRKGPDGDEGTEDDGIFRDASDIGMFEGLDPALFSVESSVFRIWAESSSSEDKKISKSVEAVVDTSGKIYHWKEF